MPYRMRATIKCLIVLVLAFIGVSAGVRQYHRVRFVFDGDTILLDGGERVRYLGIDCPETAHDGRPGEPLALAARQFNAARVAGAWVRLEQDQEKRDRYNRLLAYVFTKNGQMVNALIVRQGLAHVFFGIKNLKYQAMLLENQRQAMKDRLGIWKFPPRQTASFYVGNRASYRFHRPACPYGKRVASGNRVRFRSRFEAFWEGYAPCRRCNP